jgi:hypothetical protein
MVTDLVAGGVFTGILQCCGKVVGYIRYEIAYVRAMAAQKMLAQEVGKSKAVTIGVFDAVKGTVSAAAPARYIAHPTPVLRALADEFGGLGTKTACGNTIGCCAEFHGAQTLIKQGSLLKNIRFTPAYRPNGELKAACDNCVSMFEKNLAAKGVTPNTPQILYVPLKPQDQGPISPPRPRGR